MSNYFEDADKNSERKSLQEQLRLNSVNRQEEFQKQIQERNSVINRMTEDDVRYYQKLKKEEISKDKDLEEYIEQKTLVFEMKQRLKHQKDFDEMQNAEYGKKSSTIVTHGNLGIMKKSIAKAKRIQLTKRGTALD